MQLKYHVTSEEPIRIANKHFSVLAARHAVSQTSGKTLADDSAQFTLPFHLSALITEHPQKSSSVENSSSDWSDGLSVNESQDIELDTSLVDRDCFQSHMTCFKWNPYSLLDNREVGFLYMLKETYFVENMNMPNIFKTHADARGPLSLPDYGEDEGCRVWLYFF